MTECKHEDFLANVLVNRMNNGELFMADVTIICRDCEVDMLFIGLPMGLNLYGSAMSADRKEARLAIEPSTGEGLGR